MPAASIRIPQEFLDEIVEHAREDLPNECCGVLTGADGEVRALTRTANPFASPVRYEIDPEELYRVWKQADETGQEIVGFYHSHVKAPAYPSQTDINWAVGWPEATHVICSLGGAGPDVRAFSIADGQVEEVELVAHDAGRN